MHTQVLMVPALPLRYPNLPSPVATPQMNPETGMVKHLGLSYNLAFLLPDTQNITLKGMWHHIRAEFTKDGTKQLQECNQVSV